MVRAETLSTRLFTSTNLLSTYLYTTCLQPLSVVVADMDWHKVDVPDWCSGWGNNDVNVTLWPNMSHFMTGLHEDGIVMRHPLRISLNVHPNVGIDVCNDRYFDIAAALGHDTSKNVTIPCDFSNASYVSALYRYYYDAEPISGCDVWWTDFGGCGPIEQNSLQLWTNRIIYDRAVYVRQRRGMSFSRYGGKGNHRYPIGFSGDTFQHEAALSWQVQTTSTAANVMFGWWSHDIGGNHLGNGTGTGSSDPHNATAAELFVRWVQFGAVSPILRTHCGGDCERRIWMWSEYRHLKDALLLRHALEPYLYTEAAASQWTAVVPVHPLYYDFPQDPAVYDVSGQYMFGVAIMAAPITDVSLATGNKSAVTQTVYIPRGVWSNWNGTEVIRGPARYTTTYGLGDVPLFVRGGLIPLKAFDSGFGAFSDPIVWAVWPGANRLGTQALYS